MKLRTETINDTLVTFIAFKNDAFEVEFSSLGASINQLKTPNKNNQFQNIALTFKNFINNYTTGKYPGSTIGPYAGRIFPLNLKINDYIYKLQANNGVNFLHSFKDNYALKNFKYKILKNKIIFELFPSYLHYPGPTLVKVIYQLNRKSIKITYEASANQDTFINITNHTYFNLSGDYHEDILNHQLESNFSSYIKQNKDFSPVSIEPIKNLSNNFKKDIKLEAIINDLKDTFTKGLDHALIFKNKRQLTLKHFKSGRFIKLKTDYPSVVLYSNNSLSKAELICGVEDFKYSGLAIEPQYIPNEMNLVSKPNTFIRKDNVYRHFIKYEFGIIKE